MGQQVEAAAAAGLLAKEQQEAAALQLRQQKEADAAAAAVEQEQREKEEAAAALQLQQQQEAAVAKEQEAREATALALEKEQKQREEAAFLQKEKEAAAEALQQEREEAAEALQKEQEEVAVMAAAAVENERQEREQAAAQAASEREQAEAKAIAIEKEHREREEELAAAAEQINLEQLFGEEDDDNEEDRPIGICNSDEDIPTSLHISDVAVSQAYEESRDNSNNVNKEIVFIPPLSMHGLDGIIENVLEDLSTDSIEYKKSNAESAVDDYNDDDKILPSNTNVYEGVAYDDDMGNLQEGFHGDMIEDEGEGKANAVKTADGVDLQLHSLTDDHSLEIGETTEKGAVYPEIIHALDFKLIELDDTPATIADLPPDNLTKKSPVQGETVTSRVADEEETDVITEGCAVYPEIIHALDFKLIEIDNTAADLLPNRITLLTSKGETVIRVADKEETDVITEGCAVYPEIIHGLNFKLIEIDNTAADVLPDRITVLTSKGEILPKFAEEENTDGVTEECAVYPEIIHGLDFKLIEIDTT